MRTEMLAAVDLLARDGTLVIRLTSPEIQNGIPAHPYPESDPARMARFNELVFELEKLWPAPGDSPRSRRGATPPQVKPADFRIRLHIHVGDSHSLGPGKAALLEAIQQTGSISAAARSLGMAYRHAWELVDDLNACFAPGVVEAAPGGREGGGARLTPFGEELVRRFRAMEATASAAIAPELAALAPKLSRSRRKKTRTRSAGSPRARA